MKLIKCYIENFGKLSNFNYEFSEGLNIIKEENGFGKTTFAVFIKSMFYGLDTKINVKTENSERKKYYPWQGGNYGGNIEFEIKGKRYKIERFFGKKQVDDTFKLYDLSTNLESKDFTKQIGEEIFKINKDGYERSTYIPQGKIQIEMEDSISAKLGNVLESDNDINTSDQAIKKLNETKKIYQKDKGKGGLIDEKKAKLNILEREFENSKIDYQVLENKKQKLEQKTKEIKEEELLRKKLDNAISQNMDLDRKKAKLETYKTIETKYKQLEEKLKEIETYLNSEEISNLTKKNINIDIIDEAIKEGYRLPEIEKNLENKRKEKEEIQANIKKNNSFSKVFLIIGLIIIILGILLIILNEQKIIGIICALLGTIFATISILYKKKSNKQVLLEYNKQIQQIEVEKNQIETKLDELVKNNKTDKIVELSNLKLNLNNIQNKQEEYNITKVQLEFANNEKQKFEMENNLEELKEIPKESKIDEAELKEKIFETNRNIDKLVDEKNQLKNEIELLENKIDDNEFLESDIESLKQEIEDLTEKYKIINKAEELLKSAKQSFSSSYLNEMITGFKHYLQIINQKEMSTNVDIKLDVKVEENGKQKEIKYYSYGYKDLIYMCVRFSLIKSLFKDEKPFVILDDPFVNLDDEKTKKAVEVLEELSKEYQIIYFICNSSRI